MWPMQELAQRISKERFSTITRTFCEIADQDDKSSEQIEAEWDAWVEQQPENPDDLNNFVFYLFLPDGKHSNPDLAKVKKEQAAS